MKQSLNRLKPYSQANNNFVGHPLRLFTSKNMSSLFSGYGLYSSLFLLLWIFFVAVVELLLDFGGITVFAVCFVDLLCEIIILMLFN